MLLYKTTTEVVEGGFISRTLRLVMSDLEARFQGEALERLPSFAGKHSALTRTKQPPSLGHGITRLAQLHRRPDLTLPGLLGVRRPDAQRPQPTQEKGPSAPTTQVQWGIHNSMKHTGN